MALTYSQTAYSSLTISNNEATISYSGLDYNADIGDTIEVYNDTTKLNLTTNYTLDTTNKNVILKTDTFTGGTTISVYRKANKTARQTDFANASVLTEADLDNSALQSFHVAQEALDTAEQSITVNADGTFDANNARIVDVSDPVNNQDAATKAWVNSNSNTATVAGIESDVTTVAGIHANVTTVAGIHGNVTTVANDAVDIGKVAGKEAEIGRLGAAAYSDGANAYLAKLGVDAMSNATTGNIKKVADVATEVGIVGETTYKSKVETVADSTYKGKVETVADSTYKGKVETVADSTYKGKVETVADSTYKGKVETVADSTYKGKVETVAGSAYKTKVEAVADAVDNVNNFANTYFGAHANDTAVASHISTNSLTLGAGDLYYNTTDSEIKSYDGSSWESMATSVGGNTVTSTSGNDLNLVTPSNSNKVVINSGNKTIQLPNVRASQNNYVLAMDNISTGTTAWQATATAPTINSVSGALNHDQDSTLTLFGADFKDNTTVSLWNASSGGSKVGSDATITNQTSTKLEATFGHGSLSAGDTVYVEADNSGINARFGTAFVVSADPTVTFTQGTGSGANTTNHLGTYGGRIAGGPQDSNTKLLLNFDRTGGTDIEDSSNIGGDGHKVTASGNAVIKASPFGDGKSAIRFDAVDGTEVKVASFNTGTGLGAGAFTLEAWVWCEEHDSDSANPIIIDTRTGSNGFGLEMVKTSGQLFIWDGVANSKIITESANTLLPLKTWTHVAIVRTATGTPVKLYLNGKEAGASGNNSSDYSSETLTFGRAYNANGSNFKGYQDEIRVVVGTAVYTGDFDVPTSRLSATQSNQGTNIADITGTATKLLIHSDKELLGSAHDGSQYDRTIDTTSNGTPELKYDSTVHNNRSAWGNSSWYFAGGSTGEAIQVPHDSNFVIATSDIITLECWIYVTGWATSDFNCIANRWGGDSDKEWIFGIKDSTKKLFWRSYNGSAGDYDDIDGSTALSLNTWYHVVLTGSKDGSPAMKIYLDGTAETLAGTVPNASLSTASTPITIGKYGTNLNFEGYITDFRFIKGEATYTGNFTKPNGRLTRTGAEGDSSKTNTNQAIDSANTLVLISGQSGVFTDSSSSTHSITPTGSYHSQGHGGIAPAMAFPASLKKTGSAGVLFTQGSADYITTELNPVIGTGAFTIDFWCYPLRASGYEVLVDTRNTSNLHGFMVQVQSDRRLRLYVSSSSAGAIDETTPNTEDGKITLNAWNHIAVGRVNGGKLRIHINGKGYAASNSDSTSLSEATLNIGNEFGRATTYTSCAYIDSFRYSNSTRYDTDDFSSSLPTKIYGAYKSKTIPTITFTGQLASGSLASDEDIEFSNVANDSIPSGMQKLDDTKIGLTLTNLTGSDKNKATLTGTISDNFSGTSRANLPVKAQVRTERGDAAYDSTGSSKRLVTFSGSTNTEGLQPGYTVTGTGIPAGTTITSIDSSTTLTLSADTTGGNLSSQTLHFGDPERQIHVNGSEVLSNSDSMLTIAVDSESRPTLFNARRYEGNGTKRDINGFGFQPDLVWIKNRDLGQYHILSDSVRGATKSIFSNINNAEETHAQRVLSFNSDGVTIGTKNDNNAADDGIIAWAWKAGGPNETNGKKIVDGTVSDFTIASGDLGTDGTAGHVGDDWGVMRQSVSQTSGFSITRFQLQASGDPSSGDFGWFKHNLSSATNDNPDMIIFKRLDGTGHWYVWHSGMGAWSSSTTTGEFNQLFLQTSDMKGSAHHPPRFRKSTSEGPPTNDGKIWVDRSAIYGTDGQDEFICYAWKAVPGVSAFGSYQSQSGGKRVYTTHNGNAPDAGGTNGFRPKFIMTKALDYDSGYAGWTIIDGSRVDFGSNSSGDSFAKNETLPLFANKSFAEGKRGGDSSDVSEVAVDIFDDGFKFDGANNPESNGSGSTPAATHIYMAFA